MSGSDYNRREGYLEPRMNIANKDLVKVDGGGGKLSVLPFTDTKGIGQRRLLENVGNTKFFSRRGTRVTKDLEEIKCCFLLQWLWIVVGMREE